jgi:hypothetical protein
MKRCLLLAIVVACASSNGFAQSKDAVKRACKADAQQLCGNLHGPERKTCMRQHGSELSTECQAARSARRAAKGNGGGKADSGRGCAMTIGGKCRSQAWVQRATRCNTEVQAQSFPSHMGGAHNKGQYAKEMRRRCMHGGSVYGQ